MGDEKNFPIAPVNTPKTVVEDPQFKDRFPLYSHQEHGADMLPFPLKLRDETLSPPTVDPTVGENSHQVHSEVLGYDAEKIRELEESGALG